MLAVRIGLAAVLATVALLFRPHRSTTYVDAAYCYRPSSLVYLSVCLSQWWAMQKRLNWWRCRLGLGLEWAKETL